MLKARLLGTLTSDIDLLVSVYPSELGFKLYLNIQSCWVFLVTYSD